MKLEEKLKRLRECQQKAFAIYFDEYPGSRLSQYLNKYHVACPFCEEYGKPDCNGECLIYYICSDINPIIKEKEELLEDIRQFDELIKDTEEQLNTFN